MTNNAYAIYQLLNFNAQNWWAHRRLRGQGYKMEARREERRAILSDLETIRKAQYVLVSDGRWVIVTGQYSNTSGYGWMENPLVLACALRGIPCVDYSRLDRETSLILPVPGPDYPARTGHVGMLDDVSFNVHAAIAKFAGATLYNIVGAGVDRYVVSRDGSGWMVVDTDEDRIDEAKSWLIAKAITTSHDGWDGDMWVGEKWLPITFWVDDLKDERELAALIHAWHNDGFDGNGESRFRFGGEQWIAEISENMGLNNISRGKGKSKKTPKPKSYFKTRVDKLVRAILDDRADYRRSLDECFEQWDGDQVVTAVIRRARKNPHLDKLILEKWSPNGGWYKTAALRDEMSNRDLEAEADAIRKINNTALSLLYEPENVFRYGAGIHYSEDGHRFVDALHDFEHCHPCLGGL